MSASNKQIVVSGLKQMEADLEAQLTGVRAALAAFGGTAAKAKGPSKRQEPRKVGKRAGGMTPGIQAALDARAVKSGKATPEQVARYEARVAAKAAAAPAEGASLAEAAAS